MFSDDESISEVKEFDLFSTENVTPPAKAEKPFTPLMKVEGVRGSEKGRVVCSEMQSMMGKYRWCLMIKFGDNDENNNENNDVSLFVKVECDDEKWELRADVSMFVINESDKYESLDFSKYTHTKIIHKNVIFI